MLCPRCEDVMIDSDNVRHCGCPVTLSNKELWEWAQEYCRDGGLCYSDTCVCFYLEEMIKDKTLRDGLYEDFLEYVNEQIL